MSERFDAPRILLAAAAACILLYRFSSQAWAALAFERRPAAFARSGAAFLATVGAVWTVGCLIADVPRPFAWPGVVLGFVSSATYLVLVATTRRSAGAEAPSPSRRVADEVVAATRPLAERRILAWMVLILGVCGGVGAMTLEMWSLVIPFLLIVVGAWAALVVMFFRS
jgi:hypothetical protein